MIPAHLQVPKRETKRGILIELSYPSHLQAKMDQLVEMIQKQSEQIGETSQFDLQINTVNFSNENNRATCMFFRQLACLWEEKGDIVKALEEGKNIIKMSYTMDLVAHGYANNCFHSRETRDVASFQSLVSKFQGLPQPDVILCFRETPGQTEKAFVDNFSSDTKVERNEIFNSKLFKREEAKSSIGYLLDNVRAFPTDSSSIMIDAVGCILSRKVFAQEDAIKFY